MIFSLVLMCLDMDENNCRLFSAPYDTMELCLNSQEGDLEALEERFPAASVSDAQCVQFAVGEAA